MKYVCQSCGMPMSKDPFKGGSNADGSKNTVYCSYCYQKGSFVGPTTAAEMQKFCIQKLKEMGVPRPIGWLMTRGIPGLSRWKK